MGKITRRPTSVRFCAVLLDRASGESYRIVGEWRLFVGSEDRGELAVEGGGAGRIQRILEGIKDNERGKGY